MCTPRPRGTLSAETNFNTTLPSNTTLFPSLAGNHTVVGPNSRSRHLFTPQIHHRALGQVLPLLSNFDRNRDLNHVAPPQQRPTTTLHSLQTHPFPLQTREYFTAQESASWKERHKHPPDRTQQGNPLLTNCYPLPATRYPLPATRYPLPASPARLARTSLLILSQPYLNTSHSGHFRHTTHFHGPKAHGTRHSWVAFHALRPGAQP